MLIIYPITLNNTSKESVFRKHTKNVSGNFILKLLEQIKTKCCLIKRNIFTKNIVNQIDYIGLRCQEAGVPFVPFSRRNKRRIEDGESDREDGESGADDAGSDADSLADFYPS